VPFIPTYHFRFHSTTFLLLPLHTTTMFYHLPTTCLPFCVLPLFCILPVHSTILEFLVWNFGDFYISFYWNSFCISTAPPISSVPVLFYHFCSDTVTFHSPTCSTTILPPTISILCSVSVIFVHSARFLGGDAFPTIILGDGYMHSTISYHNSFGRCHSCCSSYILRFRWYISLRVHFYRGHIHSTAFVFLRPTDHSSVLFWVQCSTVLFSTFCSGPHHLEYLHYHHAHYLFYHSTPLPTCTYLPFVIPPPTTCNTTCICVTITVPELFTTWAFRDYLHHYYLFVLPTVLRQFHSDECRPACHFCSAAGTCRAFHDYRRAHLPADWEHRPHFCTCTSCTCILELHVRPTIST